VSTPPMPPIGTHCEHCGEPIKAGDAIHVCHWCFVTLHASCADAHYRKENHPEIPPV